MSHLIRPLAGQSSRRSCRAFAALAALLACYATLATAAETASAAPCPEDLRVVGLKVGGSDCETLGDGSVRVTNPRFGETQTVRIAGLGTDIKMILNAQRTLMTQETPGIPLRLNVGTRPVAIGTMRVGSFQLCDLATLDNSQILPNGIPPDAGPESGGVNEIIPNQSNCRNVPSVEISLQSIEFAAKLAGADVSGTKLRPFVLAIDDQRGGRVFGTTFTFSLPKRLVGERDFRAAFGAEVSNDQGFRPTAVAVGFNPAGGIPAVVPGLRLHSVNLAIEPAAERFAMGASLALLPHFAFRGDVAVEQQELKRLGGAVLFQPPLRLPPPASVIGIDNVGLDFQRNVTTPGPTGPITSPFALAGSIGFAVSAPAVPNSSMLRGVVSFRYAAPTFAINGDLFAINSLIKLGSARALFIAKPFRIEVNAGYKLLDFIDGSVFAAVAKNPNGDFPAFTGLGQAKVKVPNAVPVIGGQVLGSRSVLVSDKAGAFLTTVDPPLVKPFAIGAAFLFQDRKFAIIKSLDPFITVRPSSAAIAAAGPAARISATRTFRFPRGLDQVLVEVQGQRRAPRNVTLVPPRGRARVARLPSAGRSAFLAVDRPVAGNWRVTSPDAITRVTGSRIREFPYLDPDAGFGTRPRDPVQAGTPARVCWRVKNAPRGAVVDLFEDKNGRLGTGRMIATGRPARGCFDVPTGDMEPGRHWVYGVVRVGDQLISTRYWPIAITVFDPNKLGAPAGVTVEPTADGARVRLARNLQAASYLVEAFPAGETEAHTVEQSVGNEENPTAELSLRGARRWFLTVRAIGLDGQFGNTTPPIPVSATDPVVLAAEPNEVAEVGRPWALQLDTAPGQTLRLLEGPRGFRVSGSGLLTWTPSSRVASSPPARVRIEACKPDGRCVQKEFNVTAFRRGFAPFGPARGFEVTPNVVSSRGGSTVRLRAQGIDQNVTVKIDGRRVGGVRRLNATAVEFRTPRLGRGPHDVSLRIGGDFEEIRRGALVVLR